MCLQIIYLIHMYKEDMAGLNNLQWLICQNQTEPFPNSPTHHISFSPPNPKIATYDLYLEFWRLECNCSVKKKKWNKNWMVNVNIKFLNNCLIWTADISTTERKKSIGTFDIIFWALFQNNPVGYCCKIW